MAALTNKTDDSILLNQQNEMLKVKVNVLDKKLQSQ